MKKIIIIISTIILTVVLISTIVVSIIVIKSNSSYVKVEQTQSGIFIETKKNSMNIEFDDISEVKLKDTVYGNTQLDGIKWNNCEIGIFENEMQGRYYSFVEKKSKKSLILTLKSGEYACRYVIIALSSSSETSNLFDVINDEIIS